MGASSYQKYSNLVAAVTIRPQLLELANFQQASTCHIAFGGLDPNTPHYFPVRIEHTLEWNVRILYAR